MKFFLITCVLGICSIAKAQSPIIPLLSRATPPHLKKAYAGSKYGQWVRSFVIEENGQETWLLFFERKQSVRGKATNLARNHDDLDLGLTTLIVVSSSKKLNFSWSLQRVIPLGEESKTGSFLLRWLQPAQKKGFVLIVPRNMNGGFGTVGHELIAFPEGWKQQKTVRQSFKDWMNPIEGAAYSFNSVDKNGFLQAEEYITEYGDVPKQRETIAHIWNGNGWS